jgi:hypothetical protein
VDVHTPTRFPDLCKELFGGQRDHSPTAPRLERVLLLALGVWFTAALLPPLVLRPDERSDLTTVAEKDTILSSANGRTCKDAMIYTWYITDVNSVHVPSCGRWGLDHCACDTPWYALLRPHL